MSPTEIPPPETMPAPNWRKTHAFGLPEGSIRALLAVAVFAMIWVLLVRHPDQEVPDYLRDLLFIIMGHYFASRRQGPATAAANAAAGPAPLFLPRGSIRLILFGGFVAVAVLLARRGEIREPLRYPGVVTLGLVLGFLLGVALAKVGDWLAARGHRPPRWVEDAKAAVAIAAALGLIVLVWGRFDPPLVVKHPIVRGGLGLRLGSYGPEHVMGAIVGFYFGSRS